MSNTIKITDNDFEDIVLKSDKPVVVDFWAEWCAPCRMMTPIINELASLFKEKVIIGKLDVDVNPNFPVKFGIRSIPTIMIFKNGQVVDKVIGAISRQDLLEKIEKQLIA